MKKLLILFAISFLSFLVNAQDTMRIHKIDTAKYIVINDTVKIPNSIPDTLSIYYLNRVDSITFSRNRLGSFDTLSVNYEPKFYSDFLFRFTPSSNHTFKLSPSSKFPFEKITSITFTKADTLDYKSVSGFNALVDAAYGPSKYWYGKEDGMAMSEMGTDIWTAGSESYIATSGLAGENRTFILYDNLNSSNTNILRQWMQLYAGVNTCNLGIKILNENNFGPTDARELRRGELEYLRAFYYWHIVETWGGVHLTEEPFYIPNLKAKQNPISTLVFGAQRKPVLDFYNLIISDLQKAVFHLPVNPAEYGRPTSFAAKAFLARILLSNGNYAQAKQLSNDIINSGKFQLQSNYSDLWDMKNQRNSEVIWTVEYKRSEIESDVYSAKNPYGYGSDIFSANGNPTTNRGNNNLHTLFLPAYDRSNVVTGNAVIVRRNTRNGWPFVRFKPSKFLMELYDEAKDERYNGSFQTMWKLNTSLDILPSSNQNKLRGKKGVTNPLERDQAKWILYPYSERDTALVITKNPKVSPNYYTYNVLDSYKPDGSSLGFSIYQNYLFPALLKFQDSTRSANPDDLGLVSQGEKDFMVIRLSEMYLIAAEASFKLGEVPSATNYLNTLRMARALPGKQSEMEISPTEVNIDFILDERAREFAGEQIRWFDLKRTGKLIERVKKYNPDAAAFIKDFHVLRPIPKAQLDFTPGLTQNPGY